MKPILALLIVAACSQVPAAAARPNILFIYTDDQSQRTLGCYRDEGAWPWVRTPNIDRLASEGVRFTTAYGASWCTPSRACVLTGLLPHGIQGMRLHERRVKGREWSVLGEGYDPEVARFWPEELRKAGYETAMIGKWHIGRNAGHGRLWDHSVVSDQNTAKGDWYNDPELGIDGAAPGVVRGYATDLYTRFATGFVKRSHDKPWMLWLCYNAPHLPLNPHPRHRDQYTDAEVPVPADVFGPRPDKPAYMREFTMFRRAPDGSPLHGRKVPLPEAVRAYNRLASAVDDGVGELLRALEESGQLDRTLIVFTSDQGYAWGEHGFAWKVGPYDACLRMPLIFRLPGRVACGAVCRQPASIVDLAPTLLGFAGVPLPWEMHGRDLRPLLSSPRASPDEPVLMEHFYSKFGAETDSGVTGDDIAGGVPYWLFLRQGRYKYIRTLVPDEIEELYDLETDPRELTNLALDARHRATLEDFRSRLLAELDRTGAGCVNSLPPPRR